MSGRAYTAAAETKIGAGEVVGGIDYSLIPDKGLRPYAENVVRQMFMLDRKTIEVSLETAGIVVVDYLWPSSVVSASSAWMLFACTSQDGRIDLEFDFGDPDLISKANGAWWQLVVDHGLLDENRHFLVSVGPEDGELSARPHWARVRLQHDWDVVGRGTDYGVLGGPPGRPGFVMMSLDEHVLIGGTTWHDWISIVALPNPIAAPAIRKAMRLPQASGAVEPRARLSDGVAERLQRALEGIEVAQTSVAGVAESLGVSWNTVNDAVLAEGK